MLLIGCQDVGPAKYLAHLQDIFKEPSFCLSSDLNRSIFNTQKVNHIKSLSEAKNINLVISGTSLGDTSNSLDKQMLCWAKKNQIPSISIIEHWSWYQKRFETSTGLILPDYIILNDSIAEEAAIKEGLPKEILKPLGNPHLEMLCGQLKPISSKSKLLKKYFLPKDRRLIFFISEEIRRDFKKDTKDFLGYDEFSVLADIRSLLKSSDHLVIKTHPSECKAKYEDLIEYNTSLISDMCYQEIVVLADKVIGMESMLLLELSIHRNDVISYRPNPSKEFIGTQLGVTIKANNFEDLKNAMRTEAKSESKLCDNFHGSKERIKQFLLKLTK